MDSGLGNRSDALPPRSMLRRWHEQGAPEWLVGYLFVTPAIVGFVVFYLWPIVRAFTISLTEWNMMRAPKSVGLGNYVTLLSDSKFWESMRITSMYVLLNIPLQTVLGLLLAVLADRLARSVAVRAVIIAPYLLSNVVAALIWMLMLDPLLGLVNSWLTLVGAGRQPFLSSPDLALVSVAGISIWRHVGFTALLFYAGLQSIPRSLYEAARLDGSSEVRMFFDLTLPLLRPVIAFVVVTSVIGSFQVFDVVAVATMGGPGDSTRTILWYIYQNAFMYGKMGYASALSMALFVVLMAVTLLQMRFLRAGSSDLA